MVPSGTGFGKNFLMLRLCNIASLVSIRSPDIPYSRQLFKIAAIVNKKNRKPIISDDISYCKYRGCSALLIKGASQSSIMRDSGSFF